MRAPFLRAGAALAALLASSLAAPPADAHVALVRGLETAAERTAVLIPGFGMAFASETGGSYEYACNEQLGTTPYAEAPRLVSLGEAGWLLADPGGLHRISPSGCEAPEPEGFPRERHVAAVAVAAGDEPTAFVADDQARIYQSDDAGATWHVLAQLPSPLPVTGLASAGGAPRRLYASQSDGEEARLAWSLDAGATFEDAALPSGSGSVALQAVESDSPDRLWLSARPTATRNVAIWRMLAGAKPETVHRVRFFGGLALGDDVVWIGDEAGGLYRSERDEPFRALQPDLAVSCLHRDGTGVLWICTPATSDQDSVLVSYDLGETLQPNLALQGVKAQVECPGAPSERCASAWNEWELDVLRVVTERNPRDYPGSPAPSAAPATATDRGLVEAAAASTNESAPDPAAHGGCAIAAQRRSAGTGALLLTMMIAAARRRWGLTARRRGPCSGPRRFRSAPPR